MKKKLETVRTRRESKQDTSRTEEDRRLRKIAANWAKMAKNQTMNRISEDNNSYVIMPNVAMDESDRFLGV